MKKFMFASICTFALVGIVMADEFRATITKVDGNKVTYLTGTAKDTDRKEKTSEVAADVKVMKGTIDMTNKAMVKAGDAIEGALKSDTFTKLTEKGVNAQITTNDKGAITQILVLQKGGKKGG